MSTQLYQLYIEEEEELKNQWNEISKIFQEKVVEKNERLATKFYQLFKEEGLFNYDDVNTKIFFFRNKNSLFFFEEISGTNSNFFYDFK